ncbi:hypothetical protein HPB47_011787 [Ixodes persulcatus]|uniref:Uncharacterized protein n=1 Tax=Ixodes persulcatus TaxID=34615 RepID=A0AC60NVC1_IXOPE|nr:hypothetical protein HPB47_011787 [Ixodes persulcatus]
MEHEEEELESLASAGWSPLLGSAVDGSDGTLVSLSGQETALEALVRTLFCPQSFGSDGFILDFRDL